MTVRYSRNGYVVTFTYAENARPTFQYNDGPQHVAYSDRHAEDIARSLVTKGFVKESE